MKLYTIADLNQGTGVFNHIMHQAGEYPSNYKGMSRAAGIGFLAAAMQSGLEGEDIADAIDSYFDAETAKMLSTLRDMYTGDDRRIHLWKDQAHAGHGILGAYLRHCRPAWYLQTPDIHF